MNAPGPRILVLFSVALLLTGLCAAQPSADLMGAVWSNDIAKVKLLISVGVDVNAKDETGLSPLGVAITLKENQIAKLLIDDGASVNGASSDAHSPLMSAARIGDIDIVKLLVAKGADVNATTSQGETALSLAEAAGQKEVVAFLKQSGASSEAALAPGDPIFRLQPPPTEPELAMYRKLMATSPAELAPFLAMRRYFRQLDARFPDHQIDWTKAPKPPDGLKMDYTLDFREQLVYMEMQNAFDLSDH